MSDATPEQIAWAAGLFEGEGCFHASTRKTGKRVVAMRLSMTDRDVVDRFASIMPYGTVRTPRRMSGEGREHHKPIHEWNSQTAVHVVEMVNMLLPYLGARRRAKALDVSAVCQEMQPHFRDRTHCPQGHPYEGDNLWHEYRKNGVVARVCRECKRTKSRDRARKRLGITPDRYRVRLEEEVHAT